MLVELLEVGLIEGNLDLNGELLTFIICRSRLPSRPSARPQRPRRRRVP
ncbi:MAG: hypothetical protein GF383_15150 [Candidatus Lokiarchaeota archaeon]|nr:hypothetical protein [Candidatus Lokiarchaeota archaeon]MBD3342853.1 hypothetical protein [Candidatus Lokiarchaeota archaeon]